MKADADFRTGRGVVTYDPSQTSPEQIVQAFNSQSFYRARVANTGGNATTTESLAGPEIQPAGRSGVAEVIHVAIGFGRYALWGLVGAAAILLIRWAIRKGLVHVRVHNPEK